MSTRRGHRRRRALASAVLAGVLAAVSATPAAADVKPTSPSPYSFTLRANAVEHFVDIFREIAEGAGFSRVTLTREVGVSAGRSEAIGAGVWTLLEDEPCLLGCDPPCTSPALANPTMARASSPAGCVDQESGLDVPSMSPPGWAEAPGPASGTGTGHAAEAFSVPGIRAGAAGSDVTASVARHGQYTGVAHAFVHDLVTASGQVRSVTSLMRVTANPDGTLPLVTYAFSVAGISGGGSRAGVDETGFTIFGQDIPFVDVVRWFNDELGQVVGIAGVLGGLGIRILAPQVGLSDDGTRYRITSPVLLVGAEQGLATQGLTVHGSGFRLAGGVFEGSYAPPARPGR